MISWGELNSLYPFFLCLSQNLTVVSLGTSLSLVAPLKVGHSLDGGVLIEEPATARGKFSYHTFRSLNISEVILSIQVVINEEEDVGMERKHFFSSIIHTSFPFLS